jgi:hypothetical protein
LAGRPERGRKHARRACRMICETTSEGKGNGKREEADRKGASQSIRGIMMNSRRKATFVCEERQG